MVCSSRALAGQVVRVYAEAATQANANELALLVAQATWRLAGGVGQMPTSVL